MSNKHVTTFRGEQFYTPNKEIKNEPETPIDEDFGDHNRFDFFPENDFGTMRKSMSVNDISALRESWINMENNRNGSCQRQRRPSQQPLELSRTRFVSMAEAVYHYQRDTPNRFHTTRPQMFRSSGAIGRTGLTMPQSPMLRCKARSRPLHVMSQKEKEELEIEEMRKHQIKAHPIPKSVLEGTVHLPEVPKKPITIPEPFNLTEMHKKLAESPNEVQKFKARPAPKHILEKPHIPIKPPVQVTKPVSPKFHYKKPDTVKVKLDVPVNQKVEKPNIRHGPVRPEPFSFEKRDEEMKRRKEERIKRQIEEERKQATSFKAQPLPVAVKKRMNTVVKGSSSSTSSENKENYVKFEAKPPVVLYKEPFKPVLQPLHLVKPAPFALTTEKRAAEREKFDILLKEKEEEQERLRLEKEKEQRKFEEKAQAELRAKLIHHAKPMPVTAPFMPEKSHAPITVPETPKFVRRLKQH